MHTILRLPDVKRSTGLSRSTIYLRIAQGTFPKPVSLGGRAVGWLEAEVQQWLQRRIEASRSESSGVGATLGAPHNFELENHYNLPILVVIMWFPPPPPKPLPAILVVDRKHPGTIEYRGKTAKLTSKQFWLLAALAETPGRCIPYDTIYKKVWGDDVVVEMQQISYHKTQLLKKLRKVAPKAEVAGLITPISGEGLILNLRTEEAVS